MMTFGEGWPLGEWHVPGNHHSPSGIRFLKEAESLPTALVLIQLLVI